MKNIERREIGVQTYWRRPVHTVEQAQVRTHTHTNEIYRLLVCFLYAELNRDKLFTAIAKCNICHISDFLFIDLGWFWWCICSGGILPRVWNIWEKKNTSKWLLLITMDYSHDISTGFPFLRFSLLLLNFGCGKKCEAHLSVHISNEIWQSKRLPIDQIVFQWKKINNWKFFFHSSQTKIFTARPKIDLSDPFYVSICRIKFFFPKKIIFM